MKLEITTDLIGGDKDVRAGEVTEKFTGADAVRLIQAGYAKPAAADAQVGAPVVDEPEVTVPEPKTRATKPGAERNTL